VWWGLTVYCDVKLCQWVNNSQHFAGLLRMCTIIGTQQFRYKYLHETGCSIFLLRLQQKDHNFYTSFNEKSPYKNSTNEPVQAVLNKRWTPYIKAHLESLYVHMTYFFSIFSEQGVCYNFYKFPFMFNSGFAWKYKKKSEMNTTNIKTETIERFML
jgi:hypothetical protein